MRVLVTGATGFVGSAVVRRALDRGYKVRALVRSQSTTKNLDGLSVELAYGSLEDTESIQKALSGCSGLFHLAADYRLWTPNPDTMYRVNVEGTHNLMRTALQAKVSKIVYSCLFCE